MSVKYWSDKSIIRKLYVGQISDDILVVKVTGIKVARFETQIRETRNVLETLLKEKEHLENLGINARIIGQ